MPANFQAKRARPRSPTPGRYHGVKMDGPPGYRGGGGGYGWCNIISLLMGQTALTSPVHTTLATLTVDLPLHVVSPNLINGY